MRVRHTDRPARVDVLVAVLAALTGIAGSYALSGWSRRFVVAPVDTVVVRETPGALVAWAIVTLGDAGHLLHVALSLGITVGLFGGIALLGIAIARDSGRKLPGVALVGVLSWAAATLLVGDWVLAMATAVPVVLFASLGMGSPAPPEPDEARRRVVAAGASALAFVGIGVASQHLDLGSSEPTRTPDPGSVDPEVESLLAEASDQELDIAGDVPGLVSPIGEFYNVDINQFDPEYPSDEWDLLLTGEVAESFTIDFADLQEFPTEHRFTTLRCVGESLNGHKLDNAIWTGTPIKPLLERADPEGKCGCAMLYAKDDYFVQFPVAALEDAFLAWGMNGRPLPRSHGHPVRLLVPGQWGETNVKWLNEIELLDEELDGYWERRGWHGTGPVETVAKLWSDTVLDDGRIEVAGHAYAGTRGIQRVEVSTDGGATWTDAELSPELPGEDVWRQWKHVYEASGTHEVVVRATDGEGRLQPEEERDSFPSGATGWVSKTIRP